MTTAFSNPTRRCDLNFLPCAVKTHIARLCAEADESLSTTKAVLRKTATANLPDALVDLERRRGGLSIGNLFCVSKEWSAIAARRAAPFRFERFNLKQFRSAIFSMRIIHLRGQHFKKIDLVNAKLPDLVRFVALLPQMPNVSMITTSDFRVAATDRSPHVETDPYDAYYLETAMKALFARVEHVSLHIKAFAVLPALLSTEACRRLARLWIDLASSTGFSAFLRTLTDMRSLTDLELDSAGPFRVLDRELTTLLASASTAGELPQLRQLVLTSPDVSPAVLDFVSLFAPTLVRLALTLTSYRVDFVPQTPHGATGLTGPFPRLEWLILEGDASALEGPLGSVTDQNMPNLKTLAYMPASLPPEAHRRAGEPPIPAPHRLVPLDTLGIAPKKPVVPRSELKRLPVARLPTRQAITKDAQYRKLMKYSRALAPPRATDFQAVKTQVEATLDFLRTWRRRAVDQQDAPTLVIMAQALLQVELERIAYEA